MISKKVIAKHWASKEDVVNAWASLKMEARCWRCGSERREIERCHIIPKALGGPNNKSNLVLLCRPCHDQAPNVNDKEAMWDYIKEANPINMHYGDKKMSIGGQAFLMELANKIVPTMTEEEILKFHDIFFSVMKRETSPHPGGNVFYTAKYAAKKTLEIIRGQQ